MPQDIKEHPAEGGVAGSLTPFEYALDGVADPSTATDFSATLVNLMRSVKDRTKPDPRSDPRLMRYLAQPPMPGERYRLESPPPPVIDLTEPTDTGDALDDDVSETAIDTYQPRIASYEPPDDSIDTGSYPSSVTIGAPQARVAPPHPAGPGSADEHDASSDYTPPPYGAYAYADDEIEKEASTGRSSKPGRSWSTIAVVGPLASIAVAGLLVGIYLWMQNRNTDASVDISTSQAGDQPVETEVSPDGASGLTVSESAQIESEITLVDSPIDSELPQGQARIEGLVRTDQGLPVPDATVEFSPVNNTRGGTVALATTAADGTYEFVAEAGCYLVHFVAVDGVEIDPTNQDRELCLASQVVGTVDGVLAAG